MQAQRPFSGENDRVEYTRGGENAIEEERRRQEQEKEKKKREIEKERKEMERKEREERARREREERERREREERKRREKERRVKEEMEQREREELARKEAEEEKRLTARTLGEAVLKLGWEPLLDISPPKTLPADILNEALSNIKPKNINLSENQLSPQNQKLVKALLKMKTKEPERFQEINSLMQQILYETNVDQIEKNINLNLRKSELETLQDEKSFSLQQMQFLEEQNEDSKLKKKQREEMLNNSQKIEQLETQTKYYQEKTAEVSEKLLKREKENAKILEKSKKQNLETDKLALEKAAERKRLKQMFKIIVEEDSQTKLKFRVWKTGRVCIVETAPNTFEFSFRTLEKRPKKLLKHEEVCSELIQTFFKLNEKDFENFSSWDETPDLMSKIGKFVVQVLEFREELLTIDELSRKISKMVNPGARLDNLVPGPHPKSAQETYLKQLTTFREKWEPLDLGHTQFVWTFSDQQGQFSLQVGLGASVGYPSEDAFQSGFQLLQLGEGKIDKQIIEEALKVEDVGQPMHTTIQQLVKALEHEFQQLTNLV